MHDQTRINIKALARKDNAVRFTKAPIEFPPSNEDAFPYQSLSRLPIPLDRFRCGGRHRIDDPLRIRKESREPHSTRQFRESELRLRPTKGSRSEKMRLPIPPTTSPIDSR